MLLHDLRELSRDRVAGSWELLMKVLKVLGDYCSTGSIYTVSVQELASAVLSINPSMAALRTLATSLATSSDPCSVVRSWMSRAMDMRSKVVERARVFIRSRVVTTISRSSAVRDAIIKHVPKKVYILESRPGDEALQLYRELASKGIIAEIVPDSCIARAVAASDIVVIGADAVTIDGWVLNKVGSRPLAMVSKFLGKPFIVLCESLKLYHGSCSELELRTRWRYRVAKDMEIEVNVFECIEPDLVTYLVTDLGVFKPTRECMELLASQVEH